MAVDLIIDESADLLCVSVSTSVFSLQWHGASVTQLRKLEEVLRRVCEAGESLADRAYEEHQIGVMFGQPVWVTLREGLCGFLLRSNDASGDLLHVEVPEESAAEILDLLSASLEDY